MLSARRRCLATCAALADAASLQRGSPALTSGSPAPDHASQHSGRSLELTAGRDARTMAPCDEPRVGSADATFVAMGVAASVFSGALPQCRALVP